MPRLETQESSVCSVDASGFGSSPSVARTTIAKGGKIFYIKKSDFTLKFKNTVLAYVNTSSGFGYSFGKCISYTYSGA